MNTEIGRFLEGRLLSTIKLIQVLYDLGLGAGFDTCAWVEGKELVIGRGLEHQSKGFLRILPQETTVLIGFPKGHQLFDPAKRGKGPPGSQTRILIRDPADVDLYVRRLVDEAYSLED